MNKIKFVRGYFEENSDFTVVEVLKNENEIYFLYAKDWFRKGEYSIYESSSPILGKGSNRYLFGVSKKYEAKSICRYLTETLSQRLKAAK